MSEQNEIILEPKVLKMLKQLEEVFTKFNIEYYMAGAFARDLHFKSKEDDRVLRRTSDVDMAVCINDEEQFQELVKALLATGNFTQDQDQPIKLIYNLGIEVDLIPYGKIEDENRKTTLTKPKVFVLKMPGFVEAAPFVVEIKSEGITLNTCPIEGLIMLKLISWDDKNHRTHDLLDIISIVDGSSDWFVEEIFSATYGDILDKYDTEDTQFYFKKVTAHYLGRKMKVILDANPELKARVIGILGKQMKPIFEAMKNGLSE